MKNTLKCLSLAAMLGLTATGVNAAESCPEGQIVHTNYYMFLDVGYSSFYPTQIENDAQGTYTHYTGADKYNNIQQAKIVSQGNIAITNSSDSTRPDGTQRSWTVEEYWRNFYESYGNSNENMIYDKNDTVSFLYHKSWWSYDANWENEVEQISGSSTLSPLATYLKNNIDNLSSSDLVKKGTTLPNTDIHVPDTISTSTDATNRWRITRTYSEPDVKDGVYFPGVSLNQVYSPAAYYIEFCVDAPKDSRGITYNANTTDTVTNLPETEISDEECMEISSLTPVRQGYTFLGWSKVATDTKADTKYAPGSDYCEDENIVLYAIWQATSADYTVTYDANGGKDAPAGQSAKTGTCIKISDGVPKLEKNKFLGWSTNKDAQEPDSKFDAGDEYCGENGSITLYAVWQAETGVVSHIITFGLIGGAAALGLVLAKRKNLFKQI